MNRKRLPLSCFLIAILVTLCSLSIAIVFLALGSLQTEVERTFGEPHPSLGYAQKLWFQALLYANTEQLTTPLNPYAPPQSFAISSNEPTPTILIRLAQDGLISDPQAMQVLLQYLGYDTQIQTGEHYLSPAMSPYQIAQALVDPSNLLIQFDLLPGWRIEEVASALEVSGLRFSAPEFVAAANQPLANFLPYPRYSPIQGLQGFLLPASYRIQKTASVDDLLRQFTQNFDTSVSMEIEQKFQQQGLSLYEGIILASIVQRESVLEEEMPLIASVFLNRWRAQMKLDSDATVQFALGFNQDQNTWWTNPLKRADFSIDSPYNTYLYAGLPPTPICNPGLAAILAVAEAPQSDYFYFRTACDGSGRHVFAKTYSEHLENACP
ncbi:MAG: endolytic transglycosylase MltG [Anaerolineales bacterium]